VQRYTWADIQDLYDIPDGPPRNLQAHYNVAPTDPLAVVRPAAGGATELVSMRWGLVPWWWKKPLKQLPARFNARAETVADKPMFRDAFARHRCVIPASGYYEWFKRPDGRQPYFISAADGGVMSFAGLWDRWKNPETGEPMISCTIIVTDANELTRPIHDRMPVVLDKADIGPWLSSEAGTELLGLTMSPPRLGSPDLSTYRFESIEILSLKVALGQREGLMCQSKRQRLSNSPRVQVKLRINVGRRVQIA
jgi:putative SOS response-associated peptidase YedK